MATRFRHNVVKVLANYQPGSSALTIALDTLIETVIEQTKGRSADELAESTCLNSLHEGPAKGVICKRCFDALEAGKVPQEPDEAGQTLTPKEQATEDEIGRQVRQMIGAPDPEDA